MNEEGDLFESGDETTEVEHHARIGKWKARNYHYKRAGLPVKPRRKSASYIAEQLNLLTLSDKQKLYFREQFESMLDEIPGFFEYEKSVTEDEIGVPLFPDSPPMRVNEFSLSQVAANERRLKNIYAHLTSSSFGVSEDNLAITPPFTKCRMDGCNFTYITADTLDRHMRTRHSEV